MRLFQTRNAWGQLKYKVLQSYYLRDMKEHDIADLRFFSCENKYYNLLRNV